MDDMEYKVINKYKYAAGFGLNKRIDNNGTGSPVCREKYEDCLVSLLDVAQNLIDIFLKWFVEGLEEEEEPRDMADISCIDCLSGQQRRETYQWYISIIIWTRWQQ